MLRGRDWPAVLALVGVELDHAAAARRDKDVKSQTRTGSARRSRREFWSRDEWIAGRLEFCFARGCGHNKQDSSDSCTRAPPLAVAVTHVHVATRRNGRLSLAGRRLAQVDLTASGKVGLPARSSSHSTAQDSTKFNHHSGKLFSVSSTTTTPSSQNPREAQSTSFRYIRTTLLAS